MVGSFDIPLISMDKLFRQKMKMIKMNLIDICRTFYQKIAEYIFFSSAQGIFSRRDHILSNKTQHNNFRRFISSINSKHNYIKLEIN